MWNCKKCGEAIEDQFDACWKCATPKDSVPATAQAGGVEKSPWRMTFKYFRGTFATWDELFGQAADFATEIGSQRVVNISHSSDRGDGLVTVWYWTDEPATETP